MTDDPKPQKIILLGNEKPKFGRLGPPVEAARDGTIPYVVLRECGHRLQILTVDQATAFGASVRRADTDMADRIDAAILDAVAACKRELDWQREGDRA